MLKARLVACLLALTLAVTPSLSPRPAIAATAAEINRDATTALNQLFEKTPDAKKLAARAKAILTGYLPRFQKVLPPKKVAKLYQIENKARALVNYELARGIPLAK